MVLKNFTVVPKSKNNYYLASRYPLLLLIHPVLKFLIQLEEEGVKIQEWLNSISDSKIILNDKIKTTKEELHYYWKYYRFLKENLYPGTVRQYPLTQRKYTEEMIRDNFARCEHLLFEVSTACQLNCKYCGYGDLYKGYEKRTARNLNLKTAKNLVNYYHELRESKLNRKIGQKICFGYYGGEPLTNAAFIYEMVDYAKSKKWANTELRFAMTTNGVLLDKYMDFLARNEFLLIISLDGNETHNAFRVFKNGNPSFQTVYRNVIKLKKRYPEYFEKKTGFVAVGHKRNSLKEVEYFFKKNFNKLPVFNDVSMVGVKADRMDEFHRIYKQMYSDLKPEELDDYRRVPGEISRNPFRSSVKRLIDLHTNYRISRYSQLFNSEERRTVSGTCAPFSHRIFLTADGKLLPCERIPQKYFLAEVNERGVKINYQQIADKYNQWFQKIEKQCNICCSSHYCSQCIFHLNLEEPSCKCDRFEDFNSFKRNLESDISTLEQGPLLYTSILNEKKRV